MSLRLLVTRPEPDAARTAAALRERGHEALVAPLLRFEPLADAAIGEGPNGALWAGLLMTSAAAARAAARLPLREALQRLPVLTGGRRTAEAARDAGFTDVTSADGDAADLVRLAAARFAGLVLPLLYLAGEDRAADLAGALAAQGVAVHTAIVYRMVAAEEFSRDVRTALSTRQVDGVLHYSKRTAEAYLRCARAADIVKAALAPTHYCLSAEIATLLAAAGVNSVRNADRPDELALLELVDRR